LIFMPDAWTSLTERIHAAPHDAVIAVTGGGASAIAELLSVPGGSRTLLEAIVPYSQAALTNWLGRSPEQFCTEETALAMAAVAYQRAARLAAGDSGSAQQHIGLASTASLVSDRPKKGDHRCHVATQARAETASWQLILEKGVRDRGAEERLSGRLILCALARAAGLPDLPPLELRDGETVVEHRAAADPLLVELLDGKRGVTWSLAGTPAQPGSTKNTGPSAAPFSLHATIPVPQSPPAGLLCGSFHPLHNGHRQLRDVASRLLGGPVYYELSIGNVDKPPLDFLSIDRRRAQFADEPLALTAAPTFAEKAAVLPGVTFVVGVDTAQRIVEPRYYGDSEEKMRAALGQIARAGCRFLVAGRKTGERFETLADVALPKDFANLFSAIPPADFRADISSTQLRRAEPS
jgi:nicotinamide mononucleotide (NMN) deamidase PncC